jgi:hypothetical protein
VKLNESTNYKNHKRGNRIIALKRINSNNNQAFLSQVGWGRLEMRVKNRDKAMVKKNEKTSER